MSIVDHSLGARGEDACRARDYPSQQDPLNTMEIKITSLYFRDLALHDLSSLPSQKYFIQWKKVMLFLLQKKTFIFKKGLLPSTKTRQSIHNYTLLQSQGPPKLQDCL